jgi:hypothetical protein
VRADPNGAVRTALDRVDGIADEIDEHAGQSIGIAADRRQGAEIEMNLGHRFTPSRRQARRVGNQTDEIDIPKFAIAVTPRVEAQLFDDARQPRGPFAAYVEQGQGIVARIIDIHPLAKRRPRAILLHGVDEFHEHIDVLGQRIQTAADQTQRHVDLVGHARNARPYIAQSRRMWVHVAIIGALTPVVAWCGHGRVCSRIDTNQDWSVGLASPGPA